MKLLKEALEPRFESPAMHILWNPPRPPDWQLPRSRQQQSVVDLEEAKAVIRSRFPDADIGGWQAGDPQLTTGRVKIVYRNGEEAGMEAAVAWIME
jgi:hypothetical protein